MIERPYLKEEHDSMPDEKYVGLGYATHRYADYIPVADDKDQFALRQSIQEIGLLEPIVLFEGAILDGRHRYKACTVTGVEPRFVEFEGDEEAALQFVLARNIARRQLTTIQKLNLREKLVPEITRLREAAQARMQSGTPSLPGGEGGKVAEQIGQMVGLSKATVERADAVQRIAASTPEAEEFLTEMLAGNIGVKTAYEKARSVSEDLDREAKAQAPPSADKQRAVLIANIQKAVDLLCGYDVGLLEGVYVEALDELEVWVTSAYSRSN